MRTSRAAKFSVSFVTAVLLGLTGAALAQIPGFGRRPAPQEPPPTPVVAPIPAIKPLRRG